MMSKNEPSRNAVELFQKNWNLYRKVIEGNYMFHREIYADVQRLFEERQEQGRIALLELGCGDAFYTAKALSNCRLDPYVGVDLSELALAEAAKNLAALRGEIRLVCANMLEALEKESGKFDIVFTSFALHHLNIDEKRRFFALCRRALKEDGLLVLIDVMREEHEDRPRYLQSYLRRVAEQWISLSAEDLEELTSHVELNDFPEQASTYQAMALEAGFASARRLNQHTWHQSWCFYP